MKNKNDVDVKRSILGFFILLTYSYLCYLMLSICLQYFPWQDDQNFLVLKQDLVNTQPWRIAFQVHVSASSLILLAGFTQFFQYLRLHYPKVHRCCGWLYICTIFVFALPSGFILALSATDGWPAQLCFILLCLFWGFSTAIALYQAINRQWLKHRDWMIRSFALSLSALSLRSWKLVLYTLQPYFDWLTPIHIYQLESWLGWLVNLFIAELIILKMYQTQRKKPQVNT